jgi:vancomycin resistance protein YoaR
MEAISVTQASYFVFGLVRFMKVFMKRVVLVGVGGLAAVSVVLAIASQGVEGKLRKGAIVGVVDVGGLSVLEAQKKVRLWWEGQRSEKLTLMLKDKTLPKTYTPGELGVVIDDLASIAQVPIDGVVGQYVTSPEGEKYVFKFKAVAVDMKPLNASVKEIYGEPEPAKVKFVQGKIQLIPEKTRFKLDEQKLQDAIIKSIMDDRIVQLPLVEEPKRITDEMLKEVTDVMAQFKTNFSAGNRPRSSNIRLASSKINGTVLLPGEQFSFNGVVGRRTVAAGFKEAGVFINGRHDTGVGGGICQVSTTLYNASLFANLKIVKRSNHSLPVPYVPVGRDATVNYGAQDLVVENNTKTPIVLVNEYTPGTLTFRILGKREPGQEVKITSSRQRTWSSKGVIRQYDPSLPAGSTRVKEGGSMGRSLQTYRTVYKNGVKVATEPLGTSYYPGGPTVIAFGPKARPKPKAVAPTTTTTTPPATGGTTPSPSPEPNSL